MEQHSPLPPLPEMSEGMPTLEERRADYVRLIAAGVNHSEASKIIGVDRHTTWRWRKLEPEFEAAIKMAQRGFRDRLIEEAERRAMRGSDKLMALLLTSYFPEKFKMPTQRIDVANPPGETFEVSETQRTARMAAILAAAQARKEQGASEDFTDLV